MNNPLDEFLQAIGRFVVCYSHIQNIFQEGIYVLSCKLNGTDTELARCFMHDISIHELENVFLTLATEHASNGTHIDPDQLKMIRTEIGTQLKDLKRKRNVMAHSTFMPKFWEGESKQHNYLMRYYKRKKFAFGLESVETDHRQITEDARNAMCLSEFIHDFLICVSDGDTHPDKQLANYFEFKGGRAVFPRPRDLQHFKNIDDYIS